MPQLNKQKCFLIQSKRKIKADHVLNIPAVSRVITQIVAQNTPANLPSNTHAVETKIKDQLNQFMGHESTYVHKNKLVDSFTHIQHFFLDPTVILENKAPFAHKIYNEMFSCPSGFHNRIDFLVVSLCRPQTILEFLHLHRVSIIDQIALEFSDNVHYYNAFFSLAHQLNYGVKPLCEDENTVTLSEEQQDDIQTKMNQRYTALSIINNLLVNIESELRVYYGYSGLKEQPGGYPYGDVEKILHFLSTLFKKPLTVPAMFLINEADEIQDLNWTLIPNLLLHLLWEEAYLVFLPEEQTLFSCLFSDQDQSVKELIAIPQYASLVRSLELFHYKHIVQHVSKQNQQTLIDHVFYNQLETLDQRALLSLFQQFNDYHTDPLLVKQYHEQVSEIWLSNQNHFNRMRRWVDYLSLDDENLTLMTYFSIEHLKNLTGTLDRLGMILQITLLKNRVGCIRLLEKIESLPLEEQFTIFKKQNLDGHNILMSMAKHQPTLMPQLFKTLESFSNVEQMQLWTQTTRQGVNLLLLLLLTHPEKHEHNLALFRTFSYVMSVLTNHKTEEERFQIMQQKTLIEQRNIIMLATATGNSTVISKVLNILKTLSKPHQYALWSATDNTGANALQIAAHVSPRMTTHFLAAVDSLNFSHHALLFKQLVTTSTQTSINDMLIDQLWTHILFTFNRNSRVELALYELLTSMTFNAKTKTYMIIYALADLKLNDDRPFEVTIPLALDNPLSPLSLALNKKRYGGCGFFGPSNSFKKIQAACTRHTPSLDEPVAENIAQIKPQPSVRTASACNTRIMAI